MKSELVRQLLALTLASSLGMITALVFRRIMRRVCGAGASYALWALVPLAMFSVLLPHVHGAASRAAIPALPASTFPLSYTLHRSFDSLAAASTAPIDGARWTLGVWGAGAALLALYLAGLQRAFVKSLGTLSGLQCVRRAEHSVGCPALIGVIRPKVILPADFRSRYTRLERLLVLSHERTHLRRGDPGCNALLALMRCIFWFNPLMHVAARYFRCDQELACDAAVLAAHRGSRRPYANAMLKTHLTEGALPIGCHWRSAQDLKERMRMLGRPAPNRRRRLFGGALTMIMAVAVAYAAWAAEPVVGSTTTPATGTTTAVPFVSVMGWKAAWAGWLTSPDQAPDQAVFIAMRSAELFLTPGVTMEANADMARSADRQVQGHVRVMGNTLSDEQGHPQTITLEGHVHLIFTSPAGSASPQTISVDTNKAVLAGQPDGSRVVQVEEATVQTVLLPQFVGTTQTLPQLLTPNAITPNFKDADISRVAAAVSMAAHRTFVIDPRVQGLLTMVSTTPMTPEAFDQAFLDILRTRGFVAMPVGPATNAIRILPGTTGP